MAFDWPLAPFNSDNNKYDFYFDVPTGRIRETLTGLIYPYTWVLVQDATGFKNPKQFATVETADQIKAWAENHFSSPSFEAKQLQSQTAFSQAPFYGEFQLEASSNFDTESFNIGLLAFTLAKFGDAYARDFFESQLKQAGLQITERNHDVVVPKPKSDAPAKPAPKPLTPEEMAPGSIVNPKNVPKA